MNFTIIRMRSESPRDYDIMVLFFFVFLTCRHLISSASPVHPLLNCSSACALWHQCVFFLLPPSVPTPLSLSLTRMQSNCRRGATVHFSCDEGYELQGSKSISCLRVTDSYVGWSDDRPICRGENRQRRMCASSPKLVSAWPPVIFSYPSALIAMRSFPAVVGRPAQSIVSPLLCVIESFFTAPKWLAWHWPYGCRSFTSCCSVVPPLSCPLLTSHSLLTIFVTGR